MKAWLVRERDSEFATVVFAETRGKARSIAMQTDACADAEFTSIEVSRKPQLDKYYTPGKKEMDWYNDADRIALVKDGGFCCSYECGCEFEECPAHQWCDRYEEEKEAVDDMAEALREMKEDEDDKTE